MKNQPKKVFKEKKKGTPKENNQHAYGNGNGKFGKKAARIKRAKERAMNEN